MQACEFPELRLRPREERRLQAGHAWVFSNEVDVDSTPLSGFEPGSPVSIVASNGKSIGTGYVNPHSLIAARLISRDRRHPFSASYLVHRFRVALALRQRAYTEPFYRLVYAESDGLPGLVVDRYGDRLVAQITTAGMERMKGAVVDGLRKLLSPMAILWRNDAAIREMEGLERYVEPAFGSVPETVVVTEHGAEFLVSLSGGQKTGWFFDQRSNRGRLRRYVSGLKVLDLYSYVGGWGIQAALAGAASVLCVDGSASALTVAAENARRNGVTTQVSTREGDVCDVLESLRADGERFDVIVLDPPAFIKRRKDIRAGQRGYARVNRLAMRLLSRDGLLVSCSCSSYLQREQLLATILSGARHLDRAAQVLEFGGQGPDHPIHPAIPETDYLKACFARILAA